MPSAKYCFSSLESARLTKTTTITRSLAFIPRPMDRFQVKNEEFSTDKVGVLLLPFEDTVDGWLLSTSTTIFSKMDLSKPLPPPPYLKTSLSSGTSTKPVPCQSLLNQSSHRTPSSSDSSNAGMIDDPPGWSGSDTTVGDHSLSDTEVWDSYFWSKDKKNMRTPVYECYPKVFSPTQLVPNLSSYNRNFASANLSELNINESPTNLRRSAAIRTPRRTPQSLPHNTYSPFAAVSPSPTQSYDYAHKSWPLRCDSQSQAQRPRRPPLRSRANTTPANCTPLPSSNLSTCSTLDDRNSPSNSSTSSASGLYMRSTSASPDLMDLMGKSCFEEDSDDEESTFTTLASEVASLLRIRSTSSSSSGPGGKKEKQLRCQKSRRNLKAAGDKVRSMLGKMKSPDVA